jgi:hypothetical protein
MNLQSLQRHVRRSEVRVSLLGGYQGPYSIGVGLGDRDGEMAFILCVGTEDVRYFPTSIPLDGENVPVIVRPGYADPHFQRAAGDLA